MITENDIATVARLGQEADENLRQLFDWQHQRQSMLLQIVAAALLAVVGGLLASILSIVPGRDYGAYWPEELVFAALIIALFWTLRRRWQQLQQTSQEFLIGLHLLHQYNFGSNSRREG